VGVEHTTTIQFGLRFVKETSLVLNSQELDHGGMTTRLLSRASLSSLRSLASSQRRGHLAGLIRPAADRDLDRISADLLYLAQADPASHRDAVPSRRVDHVGPVDLDARRTRAAERGAVAEHPEHAEHAQAS